MPTRKTSAQMGEPLSKGEMTAAIKKYHASIHRALTALEKDAGQKINRTKVIRQERKRCLIVSWMAGETEQQLTEHGEKKITANSFKQKQDKKKMFDNTAPK